MRRYDAVISDIDGCLGPESAAPLDAAALARVALYNVQAQAHRDRPAITLCSGRPQPYAEALSRLIANTTLPVVAEMGVWLYDPADNAYYLDPAIEPAHLAAVRAAGDWIATHLLPRGIVIQPGKTASLSLWHRDTHLLMSLKPLLADTFAANAWPLRVSSTVAWVNCDLAHVSKATGIARLVDMRSLDKARLAGIGDTLGDMAIRDHVAHFACPANADPRLKAVADYVSPNPEIEGVLDILERLRG